jgi:hypothetical protein
LPKHGKWPHPELLLAKGKSLSDLRLPPKGTKLRKATQEEIMKAIDYHEQEAVKHFTAARVIAEVARLLGAREGLKSRRLPRRKAE